jgi:nitronate monooxygenase
MVLDQVRHPIVLAPLAGGPATPELAIAVSEAGGLGFLAAGYRGAEDVAREMELLASKSLPFGVNVFVPSADPGALEAASAYAAALREESERHGLPLGEPRADDDDWEEKLELLAQRPPPVVSFVFGCPAPAVSERLRRAGSEVWVTVASPAEAAEAERAGADVLVVQGPEAGGHRGGFDDEPAGELGLLSLLRLVAAATDLPLVAAGGIGDGAAVAAVLAAGAAAAQLGTAFLRATEAGTHPRHRELLAEGRPTAVTRAFTGKRARGLVNRFMRDHEKEAPAAYPEVHHLTAPLRAEARRRGDAEAFNLWAGQAHALAEERPAGEIVTRLAADAAAALESARERL